MVMGAGRVRQYAALYHDHVLVKEPGADRPTPWHHDQPYYPIDGDKNCSIWLPVDPVPREVSLKFLRGSHRWGRLYRPRKFATGLNYHPEYSTQDLDNYWDLDTLDVSEHEILQWELQVGYLITSRYKPAVTMPGDCVVFHMKTLHSAGPNLGSFPRRVLSTRWLGDDCRMAPRPWQVSPPTMGGLTVGDRAVSEEFPVLWRKGDYAPPLYS
ncbi:hypothetical protein LAZ67_14001247 [Cordylochernes scorpioides]|uniref:Phytanoyl-CoA dioxygenase n=1 Tax=Cordylochernes scorpioides TaxID=51811 RepID=A0ABY6L5Y9_9ARAC|nr:hypothetical protein LAZ67_14001247 [Cordylochernes scorpioides]